MPDSKKVQNLLLFPVMQVFVFLVCNGNAYSQNILRIDTLPGQIISSPSKNKIQLNSFIFPSTLFVLGAFSNGDHGIINHEIQEERDDYFPRFRTTVDDYLQFAPIIAGYGIALSGQPDKLWLYTKQVMLTEVIIGALVPPIKKLSKVPRPDNGSYNAFPSGHTSQAFASATLFSDNFAQHKPELKILAYSSASVVGVLRVMNNRHWASDVIAGAGFGIISAKISEMVFKEKKR